MRPRRNSSLPNARIMNLINIGVSHRRPFRWPQFLLGLTLLVAPVLAAQAQSESELLRDQVRLLEQQLEMLKARMEAMEQRDQQASEIAAEAPAAASVPPTPTASSEAVTSSNLFNPQISVILDGVYYHDSMDGQGASLLGEAAGIHHVHAHDEEEGHAHGALDQGFNLRETEIAVSATVDPYFDAAAFLAISDDGDVELEEAFMSTRALPAGLQLKGGKFLSGIGYQNAKHPHQWDFVDQNLPYRNLLGDHGLADKGIQLTWQPETPWYTLVGIEVLQGDQERFGATVGGGDDHAHEHDEEEHEEEEHHDEDEHDEDEEDHDHEHGESEHAELDDVDDGPRLFTAFLKVAPEIGYNHDLQLGAFTAFARQHQEVHESGTELEHALEGDAWMWGVDTVYRYDSAGNYGAGDLKLQGEYLRQVKDLDLAYHLGNPDLAGDQRKFTEDGFYLQGVYGVAPRWQLGLRYDTVGGTNKLESAGDTLREWDQSDRWSVALTWSPTEFSRLRLQGTTADIALSEGGSESFDQMYLQYVLSLGAHGAHSF